MEERVGVKNLKAISGYLDRFENNAKNANRRMERSSSLESRVERFDTDSREGRDNTANSPLCPSDACYPCSSNKIQGWRIVEEIRPNSDGCYIGRYEKGNENNSRHE